MAKITKKAVTKKVKPVVKPVVTATATALPMATIDFSAFEENDLTPSELHAIDKKLCKKILLGGSFNMIENFDSLKNSGVIPSEVTQEHLIYQFSRMITFFDNKGYKGIEAKHLKDKREKEEKDRLKAEAKK